VTVDLGIKGRKAVVCASSKGLGKACAASLAEAGCEIFINGRDAASLAAAAQEIRTTTGAVVTAVVGDIGTEMGRAAMLEACPRADILVNNNAGPPPRNFRDLDHDTLVAGVEANMITPIMLIQAYVDGMIERRFGRIINITSGSVKAPLPGLDLSSGARAGLTAFTAGVARETAAANVTINHILPGAFDTDRLHAIARGQSAKTGRSFEDVWAARAQAIPAKRYGDPKEFGNLCAYIASEHAGYITGQNFLIDGGAFPGAF
jgi:3-oxoacyl-[acyl-carrier protein] reductase